MNEEMKKVVIENTTKIVEIINANGILNGFVRNGDQIVTVYEGIYQFMCNLVGEQGSDKE